MSQNNLYPCHQSAYRKNHSTETALVKIVNDLLCAIDSRQCTFLVMLDQSAAFDTVNQDLLLNRLRSTCGIVNDANEWLASYFKNRYQSVCIQNVSSGPRELLTGFPQGSVLGPFMYPVYTSPLFSIAEKYDLSIHMYADDTQVYLSFNQCEQNTALEKIERCISEIRQWMHDNHLKLNDSKTEFMIVGSKHMLRQCDNISCMQIGDSSIHSSDKAKNIGVIIDENLTFVNHVNSLCRTCYMHLNK